MRRTPPGWAINGVAVLALLSTAALSGCDRQSRADKCRAAGNTVTTDVETKTTYKNGKAKKSTYTEYECVTPNGEEIDEWR